MIGLVINDLRNPFFTEFATSVQLALSSRGYATILANAQEDAGQQDHIIMSMIEHRVSALVISPSYGDTKPAFDRIAQAGIPAVQVLRRVDDRSDLFPFASFDYRSGARQAAAHLHEAGARSIGFVGGMENRPISHERVAGYRQFFAARQGASGVFPGETTRGFGLEAARLIAEKHESVDAALCFNDLIALGM